MLTYYMTFICVLLILFIGEGNGTPLQYSCLENPMDGGAWWAAVHGVAKSQTRLSDFTFTVHLHALEKEMATHSSVLAWRIPETGEPGGLLSMGSHRVGHDWCDLAAILFEGLPRGWTWSWRHRRLQDAPRGRDAVRSGPGSASLCRLLAVCAPLVGDWAL